MSFIILGKRGMGINYKPKAAKNGPNFQITFSGLMLNELWNSAMENTLHIVRPASWGSEEVKI